MTRTFILPGFILLAFFFGAATLMATAPVLEPQPIAPVLSTVRVQTVAPEEVRREVFGGGLPESAPADKWQRRTLGSHINSALTDLMLARPELLIFGEDVGKKGGVYGVTAHLQRRFGD